MLWLTLPATVAFGIVMAFFYAWLIGHILARHVLAPLAASSPNAIVVVTLGVSMVLTELARISADTLDFWLPPMLSAPVVFAAGDGFQVTLTVIQLIDCAIVVLAIALAGLALDRTPLGRAWRAVCDDPRGRGDVRRQRAARLPLVGGHRRACCGAGRASSPRFYYGNMSFGTGLIFGLKILFITAVGGYNTPPRAAAGAAAFGMAEVALLRLFPDRMARRRRCSRCLSPCWCCGRRTASRPRPV